MMSTKDPTRAQAKTLIPHITNPDFGKSLNEYGKEGELKATWLGHASVLVEFPTVPSSSSGPTGLMSTSTAGAQSVQGGGKRGVRVLFDPVLGEGMAFWGLGPKRESSNPCKIPSLPQIDIIAISHNHYDHLDLPTLSSVFASQKETYGSEPVLFLPLNNRHVVSGLGLGGGKEGGGGGRGEGKVIELDWWEGRRVVVDGVGEVEMTCTPCQHTSARYPWDRDKSLWSSWVAKDVGPGVTNPTSVFFGGDTGYCALHSHPNPFHLPPPPSLPYCPAFKDIGDKLGPFTLGLIPIGAYFPTESMSGMHVSPGDSVKIFQDTKCKQALGIHWGTFRMTPERFTEPPEMLAAAVREAGLDDGVFGVCGIGETRGYS
ncbi:hypothetical protein, variant 2 [Cryptococcus amylolentus CBS 6039]|nr:hypothetical protein, variant 1 [Cryptococcus amylolentus CBS 6039]XP_018994131.1 hypothetical protein, variant 2 [Cryptococcus amylolentus CBS 6039]ODN79283.1 hypothetical protein, variant 1 [Cryptococcus amylolentus CBS 6039]ODN79284.1 hypothetical protein, variant 2 [Cryptococcus amylolentus CBS 6039]